MDAFGSGISLSYDLAGRRTHAKTTGGSSQSYTYNALGNIIGLTDGLSHRTEFILDSWGRITGIRKPDGSTEQYTYDYIGNMLSSQDGGGNIVSFGYDLNGNMTTRIDQSGNRELFGYDKENRLVSMTDRNGNKTRITYNMYGSMTGRTATDASRGSTVTESYGYYPDGKLRFAIGGGMRYDYVYDIMGRLSQKKAIGRTLISNEYDLNGNRIAMTDLTGKRCEYRYNSLEQLEEIIDNGIRQVRYHYNADGTVRRMEVGTGLVTEYTYDADKNVISQKTVMLGVDELQDSVSQYSGRQSLAGNLQTTLGNLRDLNQPLTLVDNTYAYDANGNRTTKQTLSGLTAYHYDATKRLVKVDYPTGSEEYRYDKAGNRTEKLINGVTAERYQYDVRNRLISQDILALREDTSAGHNAVQHREYTYDAQGNMLSDGQRSFTYDAMNRLSQVTTADGQVQKNFYDGEGLRAEMEENGRLVSFLYDGEKAKTYYHYVSDEMGSITHITDEAGNLCNHYEYDAFGDFTVKEETVHNRFCYIGEQYDPVAGLYYLRARFYNPVIGRFIQEDTYYGDGLNLYSYCQNNPVKYVDPSGHETCDAKQQIINTIAEIEQFRNGEVPARFTWHHHQTAGKMQLVDFAIHDATYHKGGFSFWGPGNKKTTKRRR